MKAEPSQRVQSLGFAELQAFTIPSANSDLIHLELRELLRIRRRWVCESFVVETALLSVRRSVEKSNYGLRAYFSMYCSIRILSMLSQLDGANLESISSQPEFGEVVAMMTAVHCKEDVFETISIYHAILANFQRDRILDQDRRGHRR